MIYTTSSSLTAFRAPNWQQSFGAAHARKGGSASDSLQTLPARKTFEFKRHQENENEAHVSNDSSSLPQLEQRLMCAAVGNKGDTQLHPPERLTMWANDVFIKI